MEAEGAKGYAIEYSAALWHTFRLAWKVRREQGIGVSGGRWKEAQLLECSVALVIRRQLSYN